MTIQPIPAIRFNASQVPFALAYAISLPTTGGQAQLMYTGFANQSIKITYAGWLHTAGTLTGQVAFYITRGGTNYNIAMWTFPAVSTPVQATIEAWLESGDKLYVWCNVSVATVTGNAYIQGLKYVTGEGALG